MDLSTSGGAILVTILRLIHIISGVLWVGVGVALSMYFEPALSRSGVDVSKVTRALYTKTGFDKLMPIVALLTTGAGLILYWAVSNGFSADYMRSGQGIVLGIGVVLGLLAFGHGAGALGRMSGKYVALVKDMPDTPTDAQQGEITAMEAKLMRHARISMWLGVGALFFMAGARYVGPLFG